MIRKKIRRGGLITKVPPVLGGKVWRLKFGTTRLGLVPSTDGPQAVQETSSRL
jgi:hypothetical protein